MAPTTGRPANKTRLVHTSFKIAVNTGLETGFCFMVVNKGCYDYYVSQSSNNKNRLPIIICKFLGFSQFYWIPN